MSGVRCLCSITIAYLNNLRCFKITCNAVHPLHPSFSFFTPFYSRKLQFKASSFAFRNNDDTFHADVAGYEICHLSNNWFSLSCVRSAMGRNISRIAAGTQRLVPRFISKCCPWWMTLIDQRRFVFNYAELSPGATAISIIHLSFSPRTRNLRNGQKIWFWTRRFEWTRGRCWSRRPSALDGTSFKRWVVTTPGLFRNSLERFWECYEEIIGEMCEIYPKQLLGVIYVIEVTRQVDKGAFADVSGFIATLWVRRSDSMDYF